MSTNIYLYKGKYKRMDHINMQITAVINLPESVIARELANDMSLVIPDRRHLGMAALSGI